MLHLIYCCIAGGAVFARIDDNFDGFDDFEPIPITDDMKPAAFLPSRRLSVPIADIVRYTLWKNGKLIHGRFISSQTKPHLST